MTFLQGVDQEGWLKFMVQGTVLHMPTNKPRGRIPHRPCEALRPMGLAVTACDYLESVQITSPSAVLDRCLWRYMMKPSLGRLLSLWERADSGSQLRDEVLEGQHSLGTCFTKQALQILCDMQEWPSEECPWVLLARRDTLGRLAVDAPEAFETQDRSASTILAWISCSSKSRGRLSGFNQDGSRQWLRPIQVEHERQHLPGAMWGLETWSWIQTRLVTDACSSHFCIETAWS